MEALYFNKHFIQLFENKIIHGFSDAFQQPGPSDICINSEAGYQFRLFPGGEENPPLRTGDGIPLYRWDGQAVQPRTETEIQEDRDKIPPPPAPPMTNAEMQGLLNILLGGI